VASMAKVRILLVMLFNLCAIRIGVRER